MKSEMDLMRMDERQRFHWLRANRATLMIVGAVWLLMIAFELSEGRTPEFLLVMVPIFAGVRFGFFYYYARDREVRWVEPALFVVLFGFGHWAATAAAWAGKLSTGGLLGCFPEEPAHSAWVTAIHILEFPFVTFVRHNDIDQSGWANLLMVMNSALWAGAAYLVVWAARRRRIAASDGADGFPR